MSEQFMIQGNKFSYKLFKWGFEFCKKKIKKHENKTIDITSIKFPSAFSMVIRFSIVNTNEKFEIVLQGYFQEAYKYFEETGKLIETINAEVLIRQNLREAFKIN